MKDRWIQEFPKVELHCHLDGSLPLDTVRRLAKDEGILREQLSVTGECGSLAEYLEKFALPLSCLQRKEQLEQAAEDYVVSLKEDGVIYTEVRFAPMLSTEEGLHGDEVVDSVLSGLKRGEEKTGIRARAILCAMRNHREEANKEVIRLALERLGSGVCAVDLAGDEGAYPNELFEELFKDAKKNRLPFTVHSGECGRAENVRIAYEWGAGRIGHGIALLKEEGLMEKFAEKGIGIELCPTSNLQTKAVKGPKEYPFGTFLEKGLKVSINTDNRTVSATSLNRELQRVLDWHIPKGAEEEQRELLRKLMKNAVETSFAEEEIKQELWRRIEGA